MPIERCPLTGEPVGSKRGTGYRFGKGGRCFPTREAAERQMRAMYANGYQGDETNLPTRNPDITTLREVER